MYSSARSRRSYVSNSSASASGKRSTRSADPIQLGPKSSASGPRSSVVKADTEQLLQALLDAEFEFVVIGGTAALAHGVTTPTQDLDVAAPLTEDNLRRL